MNLIICGNGFDLHHGLAMSYSDYKNFLTQGYPWDHNYSHVIKNYESNNYLESPVSDRWTDVEASLKVNWRKYIDDYINVFHPRNRVNPNSPTYQEEIETLCKRNSTFTKEFFDNIIEFTGLPFFEWLANVDLTKVKKDLEISNDDLYITFNYTSTLEKIYNIKTSNILYIHGCLNNITRDDLQRRDFINGSIVTEIRSGLIRSELQFGSVYNNPKPIKELLINQYKENDLYNNFYKPMIESFVTFLEWSYKNVEKNLSKTTNFIKNQDIDTVVIMGHSLLGVDDYYYENIFVPKFKSCKWKFYWHNYSSKDVALEFEKKYGITFEFVRW